MNDKLIAAVYEQNGSWQSIHDVMCGAGRGGAADGYSGFIYYGETSEFYSKNWELIREVAKQQAEDLLVSGSVAEMIGHFKDGDELTETLLDRGWKGIAEDDSDDWGVTQFKNTMSWFALEQVSIWLETWSDYPEDIPEEFRD